jgi:lipopolysaccharide heptosyltransferase II
VRIGPKNILIVLHGSIGDVVRALPLANILRINYPHAKIAWSVEVPCLPLVQFQSAIDEVIVFDRRHWWRAVLPFLRTIRTRRFDLVLDLQRHLKSGLISFLSGAPLRVGFARKDCKEFNWLFNNSYIAPADSNLSKIDHYLKFAEFLGITAQPVNWDFHLQPDEVKKIEARLKNVSRPCAVLFVGTRWESKNWFSDQMVQCACAVNERYGFDVVLLGDHRDATIAADVQQRAGAHVKNFVGQTSLREALGIIARAALAIGPDTGLMHIAAAVGTPVVSLWGATSPLRTGPYGFDDLIIQGQAACVPCYQRQCPIGRVCMQSVTTEEIMRKVDMALSRSDVRSQTIGNRG